MRAFPANSAREARVQGSEFCMRFHPDDRTSILTKYAGSMRITTHLDHTSHCKTISVIVWYKLVEKMDPPSILSKYSPRLDYPEALTLDLHADRAEAEGLVGVEIHVQTLLPGRPQQSRVLGGCLPGRCSVRDERHADTAHARRVDHPQDGSAEYFHGGARCLAMGSNQSSRS